MCPLNCTRTDARAQHTNGCQAEAPGYFRHNHVTHNCTIGSWPAEIPAILSAKGGKLKSYHIVDADHLREAVGFKNLTALMKEHPTLCHFTDVVKVLAERGGKSGARRHGDHSAIGQLPRWQSG